MQGSVYLLNFIKTMARETGNNTFGAMGMMREANIERLMMQIGMLKCGSVVWMDCIIAGFTLSSYWPQPFMAEIYASFLVSTANEWLVLYWLL